MQDQAAGAQTAYQASRLRRTENAPIIAVTMGLMLLGFGLAARRPRWAAARGHRLARRE